MKDKFVQVYMRVAREFAQLSSAKKLKVGAIIVKDNRILSVGYNGMPAGWDNECEHTIHQHELGTCTLLTKKEVLHAEMNCLMKVASSTESSLGAVMFCTHTPCIECAKAIHQAGIIKVYVGEEYEASKGCGEEFLSQCGIEVLTSGSQCIE